MMSRLLAISKRISLNHASQKIKATTKNQKIKQFSLKNAKKLRKTTKNQQKPVLSRACTELYRSVEWINHIHTSFFGSSE